MIYIIASMLAALILVCASLIFILKDVLHVALALSAVFFVNSLIFLVIGQPLLALIQLFIMVGGVSVYLFVGVAAAGYSHFKYTNYWVLAIVAIAIFSALLYGVYLHGLSGPAAGQPPSAYTTAQVAVSLSSKYTLIAIYSIALMLFLVALSAIPLLNRLRVM